MERKISYAKVITDEAKAGEGCKATVSVVFPDQSRFDEQQSLTLAQAHFLKWAAAMVFCEEIKSLPDVEGMIRKLMNGDQAL